MGTIILHYDLFNGDADGIISLIQLRKQFPKKSYLVSGVKRNISLLETIADNDDVESATVLDLSMKKNIRGLNTLLEKKVPVFYCDHHFVNEIPQNNYLETLLDFSPTTCTSLIISKYLNNRFIDWAIAGIYGDNLTDTATNLAIRNNITTAESEQLKEIGTLLNYNSYGAELDDLIIPPLELYNKLLPYEKILDFMYDSSSPYEDIKHTYHSDSELVSGIFPYENNQNIRIFVLPNTKWSRRISGVFSNHCVYNDPNKAHAILTLNKSEIDYTVSVRAPLAKREGADEFCSMFLGGGGRATAAGINNLPITELGVFTKKFNQFYSK